MQTGQCIRSMGNQWQKAVLYTRTASIDFVPPILSLPGNSGHQL